jgi:hypothetical protein
MINDEANTQDCHKLIVVAPGFFRLHWTFADQKPFRSFDYEKTARVATYYLHRSIIFFYFGFFADTVPIFTDLILNRLPDAKLPLP